MKFCAVICEYNPFHNGHAYLLGRARAESGCDGILCLMSGNFTQRGEIAVLNKYTRARHALEGGADVVLELPALYAVAPAELFSRGAVKILSSLPAVERLAFGCESGTAEEFLALGRALATEDKAFRTLLKEKMKGGESYIRARNATVLELHPELNAELFRTPNNILAAEYCRAIAIENANLSPLVVPRIGDAHVELALTGKYSSAGAIRAALERGDGKSKKGVKKSVPHSVFCDLYPHESTPFKEAALAALLRSEPEEIARATDCSEGLENRLLTMARTNPMYDDVLKKVVTKRYTLARVRRIMAQNFLRLEGETARECLGSPLYAKVLAVRRDRAEEILASLEGLPLLTRKGDYLRLKKGALACAEVDSRTDSIYAALTGVYVNEHQTLFL